MFQEVIGTTLFCSPPRDVVGLGQASYVFSPSSLLLTYDPLLGWGGICLLLKNGNLDLVIKWGKTGPLS